MNRPDVDHLAASIAPGIAAQVRRFDAHVIAQLERHAHRFGLLDRTLGPAKVDVALILDGPAAPSGYVAIPHRLAGLDLLDHEQHRRAVSPILTPTPVGPRCAGAAIFRLDIGGGTNPDYVAGITWFCLLPDGHAGAAGGQHAWTDPAQLAAMHTRYETGVELEVDDDGALEWIDSALSDPDARTNPDRWLAGAAVHGLDGTLLPWARRLAATAPRRTIRLR